MRRCILGAAFGAHSFLPAELQSSFTRTRLSMCVLCVLVLLPQCKQYLPCVAWQPENPVHTEHLVKCQICSVNCSSSHICTGAPWQQHRYSVPRGMSAAWLFHWGRYSRRPFRPRSRFPVPKIYVIFYIAGSRCTGARMVEVLE